MNPTDIRHLPRTGHALTVLGMGTAPIGSLYAKVDDADARHLLAAAWNAGLRFFDTAPFYGHGLAEHRLGEALRVQPRGDWTLSTKVGRLLRPVAQGAAVASTAGWVQPLPFEPVFDYTAGAVRRSIEDSLQRLGTHRIDIALVHDIGRYTHGALHDRYWQQLTEGGGLRELEALRREGLVGAIGLGVNEWPVVLDAMEHADLDCVLLAGRYTLLEQGALTPFLDRCVERAVGVIVGGPFNSGVLVTGARAGAKFDYADAPDDVLQRVHRLHQSCEEFGVPLAAAALQFPLAHPAVVSCIPGARSEAELQQILGWAALDIPRSLWTTLQQRGLIAPHAPLP
ncbi:aldo/keto reductase [Piscinibacter sp. XHJ-5]|uniref:aldo/keto reductase n=1 Tax=Piscinibacter sp. XHJ-5 TaxID=3037797 RepID=UPI0024536351|nr:aldo/keto reductase [Piscinibacter sp. XHJ-5]